MIYTSEPFKTKAALTKAVLTGRRVRVWRPGLASRDAGYLFGTITVCGPWPPEPERWSAKVEIHNGLIRRVL